MTSGTRNDSRAHGEPITLTHSLQTPKRVTEPAHAGLVKHRLMKNRRRNPILAPFLEGRKAGDASELLQLLKTDLNRSLLQRGTSIDRVKTQVQPDEVNAQSTYHPGLDTATRPASNAASYEAKRKTVVRRLGSAFALLLSTFALGACSDTSSPQGTGTQAVGTGTGTNPGTTPNQPGARAWTLYESPVIDMHAHTWTEFSTPSQNDEEHLHKTLEAYSQYNVVKAMISGPNFDGARWSQLHPNLFMAGSMVGARSEPGSDPTIPPVPSPSVEELRQAHAQGQLHAIGEVGFFYGGLYADGDIPRPYFQLAQELNLPMGYHLMNNTLGPNAPTPTNGSPTQFRKVLQEFPNLRLYIMHAGFPFLDETKALMAEFPNLYLEVSWIAVDPQIVGPEFANQFEPYLRALFDAGYGKRILYGSDTVLNEQIVGQSIQSINNIPWLSPEQKADIFYLNAARFLGFSQETINQHWTK